MKTIFIYFFKYFDILKMRLNKEQRIEIILAGGPAIRHGTNMTHDNVAKLIRKLKKLEVLQINWDVVM